MTLRRTPGKRTPALVAYLEGEVTASERAAIDAELEESASLRRTLAELESLRSLLAAPATELESIDLAARVQNALRRPAAATALRTPPAPPFWRRSRSAAFGFALAAALGAVVFGAQHAGGPEEFRAKSNGSPELEARRWAGVRAYRVVGQNSPAPLGATLSMSDGLVFSYTNLGTHAFGYLMIFGVDANDDVRWFYPVYMTVEENPESVPIERGRANVALGDVVQQEFAEGPLALYALFSDERADVQSIERWVRSHGRRGSDSPLPHGLLQRIDTRVVR
jgi:hypothetical protein